MVLSDSLIWWIGVLMPICAVLKVFYIDVFISFITQVNIWAWRLLPDYVEHKHASLIERKLTKLIKIKSIDLREIRIIFEENHFFEIHVHINEHGYSDEDREETSDRCLMSVSLFVEI